MVLLGKCATVARAISVVAAALGLEGVSSTCWACSALWVWFDRPAEFPIPFQAAVVVPVIWFQVVNRSIISWRYSSADSR
jgi:hypothetical protein